MTKTETVSGDLALIPLDKLKASPRNARKRKHSEAGIKALAASIAANGLLQNLVVEPERDKRGRATGKYLVTAGEGRRLAQLLRVKRAEIPVTEPIRCLVDAGRNAFELSLAENDIRTPMHPADQFEAFQTLHVEHGLGAEDIAARFGVSETVVRQRLKLAAIHPQLVQAYRDDRITLSVLTAFAITDDQARQWAAFESLGDRADRDDVLALLTEAHVAADDRRAVFVGAEAYMQAGGGIVRDLFAEEGQIFFTDATLLNRLADEKLRAIAAEIETEGWKWVTVMARYDYGATAGLRRVYPAQRPLSDEDDAKRLALEAEYAALEIEAETAEADTDLAAEFERIEMALSALTGEAIFPIDIIARAGAIVSLDHSGMPRVERGFIRPEDDIRTSRQEPKPADVPKPISDALVAELTANRAMALRELLGNAPDIALIAVTHAFVLQTFYLAPQAYSTLDILPRNAALAAHARGIDETETAQRVQQRHDRLAGSLPETPEALWAQLCAMNSAEIVTLLAHCAAQTIGAVQVPHNLASFADTHANQLFEQLDSGMAAFWAPTVANYLGRVSKEKSLKPSGRACRRRPLTISPSSRRARWPRPPKHG